ncbi:MAG: hypothetical protein U9N57_14790 [Pseudomonadota bacterium]|nr:hypothetical protein [Pseudomonadota bacterium]
MTDFINNPLLTQQPFDSFDKTVLKRYENVSKVKQLPGLFDDSSSDVWEIQGVCFEDASKLIGYVIKSHQVTNPCPFWLGMDILFKRSICSSYQDAKATYTIIDTLTSLKVPQVSDVLFGQMHCALVLEKIYGESIQTTEVSDALVKQIAKFLAEMHSHPVAKIGAIVTQPEVQQGLSQDLKNWQQDVLLTIQTLASEDLAQLSWVIDALKNSSDLTTQRIVPLMMDLRWDQFSQIGGELVGVFDLDAFVFAPIELDFVILEYLLTAQQLTIFKKAYEEEGVNDLRVPSIAKVRNVYRVLFFLINALGEDDIEKWMSQPCFFND